MNSPPATPMVLTDFASDGRLSNEVEERLREEVSAASARSERSTPRKLPLSVPADQRELLGRLLDPEHMLAVFRRELPSQAETAIHVTTCSVRPGRSERPFKRGQFQLVYRVGIEVERQPAREFVLLGVAGNLTGHARPEQTCKLRDHPAVKPFRQTALYVEDLRLELFLFPMDPALPGLAEITGSGGAQLFASFLPECRSGARLERIQCELQHYKPFNRAVLRVRATLSAPDRPAFERSAYVKVFRDERGALHHQNLASLWSVARRSRFLRVPEPLGYEPEQRLLVMSEAPGEPFLNEWIRCLRKGKTLPSGVDPDRLDRCFLVAARALGELQSSGLRPQERYTYQDELTHLRRDRDLLDSGVCDEYPELWARFAGLMRRLETMSPVDEPLVPAHGEYRHQQLVGDETAQTLIDWDSYCLANPALDAARMLARFRRDSLAYPQGRSALERVAETFRREFLAPRPEVATHLALYEGLHVTKSMLRSFWQSSRGEDVTQQMHRLATAADELLDRAACASS